MKSKNNNLDSQSSSSTNFKKHVDNNLNQQFKFSKGNIALGITPKLVLCDNQITSVPLTEPSSLRGSSNKEIKTSSDSEWRTMLKNHDTSSMKSCESRPSGFTFNAKNPQVMNSLKSFTHLPWGSISTVTTPIFPRVVTIEKGQNNMKLIQ